MAPIGEMQRGAQKNTKKRNIKKPVRTRRHLTHDYDIRVLLVKNSMQEGRLSHFPHLNGRIKLLCIWLANAPSILCMPAAQRTGHVRLCHHCPTIAATYYFVYITSPCVVLCIWESTVAKYYGGYLRRLCVHAKNLRRSSCSRTTTEWFSYVEDTVRPCVARPVSMSLYLFSQVQHTYNKPVPQYVRR